MKATSFAYRIGWLGVLLGAWPGVGLAAGVAGAGSVPPAAAASPALPYVYTRWEQFTTENGLPNDHIFAVRADGPRVWVGTENGLACYDRRTRTFKAWTEKDGLPWRVVSALEVDPKTGDLWVGMFGGGLARFSAGRFDHFNQLNSGLVNDVVPEPIIGRFFGLFRAVSLISGMVFNFYLIGVAKEHFLPILLGIGLLYGGGMLAMCLFVKEGEYPAPPPPVPGERRGFIAGLRTYGRECFSKPYYLWVLASIALAQMAFIPVNLFSVYSAESFGLSMTLYGRYIVVMYACSLLLAYPLGWLADRFHPIRVGIGSIAAYALVMAFGFFGTVGPRSFGIVFLAHGVLSGAYFTGAAAIGQRLFPHHRFAQFMAAWVQVLALGNIALGPLMGLLLDLLGHDYRYTFGAGCLIALAALIAGLVVQRRWKSLGGDTSYVAPE